MLFSWTGTNTKASFKTYKETLNVMLSAIRKKVHNYTMDELGEFFKDHLKHAKEREDRKNKNKCSV